MFRVRLARARAGDRLRVGDGVTLGRGVRFDIAHGGVVALGDGCVIARHQYTSARLSESTGLRITSSAV